MNIDEVNVIANRLIRKYDWRTEKIEGGVKLTVDDGQYSSDVEITTGESIEAEIERLIKDVDNHVYTTIG